MKNRNIELFSFFDWLNYIEKFRVDFKCNYFNNVKFIAKKLGMLKLNSFVYIVGGTNGKGTTSFVLERIFLESGYRVGLYTSPHLLRYTERVRINGRELDESVHVTSFFNVEIARGTLSLTYYDFITLSALYLFKSVKLDVVILEVGVGGKLDATNVIDSDISIITNIEIDHINMLGNSRDLIGIEKSGIFRKNKVAIIAEKTIPNSVIRILKHGQVDGKLILRDWYYKRYHNSWSFFSQNFYFLSLPLPKVSLVNTATALSAVVESKFHIKESTIRNCIDKIYIFGRFQILSCKPMIILDVAHNLHSVKRLQKKLLLVRSIGKIHAIVGILKSKDVFNIVSPLFSIVDYWHCVKLETEQSVLPENIAQFLPVGSFATYTRMKYAWQEVQRIAKVVDTILVFGSFITVSEICTILTM
ncbi:hypothetical protein XW81_00790 [Buchnera aphidicola (Schlechtendalia chinensis)]|uniref:Dihydrofolate synthase/folylpolyglutamate synthase n=1 Tax=Buchnera aphidicola subsp. Schlechtendalia chinensis TaxID=118110 RepID=A0A172WDC4_BUCSC|nr:bifunctional tetrahydrofolate synthase/dihydrofolate synthase [Buchnera aphidicola]ANF16963.1 hypothetical protein XW81_00790 [Buchnera aphidicola (Schlechtendalia chinensis)]